jgi:hypothetical protein
MNFYCMVLLNLIQKFFQAKHLRRSTGGGKTKEQPATGHTDPNNLPLVVGFGTSLPVLQIQYTRPQWFMHHNLDNGRNDNLNYERSLVTEKT